MTITRGHSELQPTQSQAIVTETPLARAELEAPVYDRGRNGFIGRQSVGHMRGNCEASDRDSRIERTARRGIELDFDALVPKPRSYALLEIGEDYAGVQEGLVASHDGGLGGEIVRDRNSLNLVAVLDPGIVLLGERV